VADELEFASRLVIKSPVKRCGKSRLLDVLAQLVRKPLATADISAAALVQSVTEKDPPTIMLDEADAIFGKALKGDEKAEHLRGILNAGFGRDRPYKWWDITTRKVEDCPAAATASAASHCATTATPRPCGDGDPISCRAASLEFLCGHQRCPGGIRCW
jgi:hypothetical protein